MAKLAIQVAPDSVALAIINSLSGRPPRPPVTSTEHEAMRSARKLDLGDLNALTAWEFGAHGNSAPLVVLTHGWGGRATQMAPLALSVSRLGFCCVAIDVTGHGESQENRTRWEYFVRDISAVSRLLKRNVHAYVSHSAAGLATLNARKQGLIRANRYVCICSPSHPYPPIRAVQAKFKPRASVLTALKKDLASQLAMSWDELQSGDAFLGCGAELLLCYDEKDRFVDHAEGDRLHALCPESRLVKTGQFGHVRILSSPPLADTIGDFLRGA